MHNTISQAATWGKWYWPIFLILVVMEFMPAEIYAIATNTANTLSDYSWHELGVPAQEGVPFVHNAAWFLTLGTYLVVSTWLAWHIWGGKFR